MGGALRQRCLIHVALNTLAKVPKNAHAEVKADHWAIFDVGEEVEPGLDAVKLAPGRIDPFAARWRDSYPAAVRYDFRPSHRQLVGMSTRTGPTVAVIGST